MNGVDLSHYQDGLDLKYLRSGGFTFAILKISEGRSLADSSFERFYAMAQEHEIPVGAYVYSHATDPTAAQVEAKFALSIIKNRPLPLGIFMDVETTGQLQLPKEQLKQTVQAFRDTIVKACYSFGIYSSEYSGWSRMSIEDWKDSTIWVAHYGKKPVIFCDLWQKSDTGTFPNYYGAVDQDEAVSERFKRLVSREDREYPFDAGILEVQTVLYRNEFITEKQVTGRYSPDLPDLVKDFADGIKEVWEG